MTVRATTAAALVAGSLIVASMPTALAAGRAAGTGVRAAPAAAAATAVAVGAVAIPADPSAPAVNPPSAPLQMPPTFESRDGVLHLRVKASEQQSTINDVLYKGMLIYDEEIVDGQGIATPGDASSYVAPTWIIHPGDQLKVDYINDLPPIGFKGVGQSEQETLDQPLNLHVHGLEVSPAGNSDNVLLAIPSGRSNPYRYAIPERQDHGLYWYHPHIHGITDDQVYEGLAGHIVVGRADGDYEELDGLPVLPMMIRYNVQEPTDGRLVDASAYLHTGTAMPPLGQMIYTVNGRKMPSIRINAADAERGLPPESQVWAFTNITGSASYVLALEEVPLERARDAGTPGTPVDMTIVSYDGTPLPAPHVVPGENGRGVLLGQGGRIAILVQGASDPTKVVRLVQVENRSGTGDQSAYYWQEEKAIPGWRDYTRTVLAIGYTDRRVGGLHVDTPASLTSRSTPGDPIPVTGVAERTRPFVFGSVLPATPETPNNFPVDDALFPENRMDQPRAGSLEDWVIVNASSLHHPFHAHVQDAIMLRSEAPFDPATGLTPGLYPTVQSVADLGADAPDDHEQDVFNLAPALTGPGGNPLLDANGAVVAPGRLILRVRFQDYLGVYVEHCHRLPHEDRGMMTLIRTIPAETVFAVTTVEAEGSTVSIVRGDDLALLGTVTPFPGYSGRLLTAIGDVDADTIPDIAVVGVDGDANPWVAYRGSTGWQEVIAGGADVPLWDAIGSIALGDLNADGLDDLVIGAGVGSRPQVIALDGLDGGVLVDFLAYDESFTGGVDVAVGMIREGGRNTLVTGSGPGMPASVRTWDFDLFGDAAGTMPDLHDRIRPAMTGEHTITSMTGGVRVSVGFPYAMTGGFAAIAVSPAHGPAEVVMLREAQTHGPGAFSVSGVARPPATDPLRPIDLEVVDRLDLAAGGYPDGADTAFVSTPTGARLVVVAPLGGRVTIWDRAGSEEAVAAGRSAASSGFVLDDELSFEGAEVSGI